MCFLPSGNVEGDLVIKFLKSIFQEMRPKQYTKNAFVFVAPLFAGKLLQAEIAYNAILAFIAFSCVASVVYIINDIADREKDRVHPTKCRRPIASGALGVKSAIVFALLLLALAFVISFNVNMDLLWILITYLLMNLAYSFKLKHVVIVDVLIIAMGFVLRAFAGAVATGVGATSWFVLCIFMLSLFLALAKRRGELELLRDAKLKQRKVLKNYSISLIDQIMAVVSAIMLTSYALFAQGTTEYTTGGYEFNMMITVPIVMYGVFRYMFLVHMRGLGEKPEEVLLHDKHILCTVAIYVAMVFFLRDF